MDDSFDWNEASAVMDRVVETRANQTTNPYAKANNNAVTKKPVRTIQNTIDMSMNQPLPNLSTNRIAQPFNSSNSSTHKNRMNRPLPNVSLPNQTTMITSNPSIMTNDTTRQPTIAHSTSDTNTKPPSLLQTIQQSHLRPQQPQPVHTQSTRPPCTSVQSHESSSLQKAAIPSNQLPKRPPNDVTKRPFNMASIRPTEWNATDNKPPPTTTTTNPPNDPRQVGLPPELLFDPQSVQPPNDPLRATLIQNANISHTLDNGWELFGHQKRAILQALVMRRKILALDMGLGKTLIGCCYIRAFCASIVNLKVYIICPVSLKQEWKRTAEEATSLAVHDQTSRPDGNVFICSWSKIPKPEPNQRIIVVCDEAHNMQSMNSIRTKDVLKLMEHADGVLLLTGTPMKNGKPSNLFPLLKAVQHPFGKHQRAYEIHFCGGRTVHFGRGSAWQANEATNLAQLRALTQSHILYLTKEECLKNLPQRTRIIKNVPVSAHWTIKHTQALQYLGKVYQSKNQEAILGAVQKLRCIDSLAKVGATVSVAKQVLETEPAVVIFTSFVQAAKNLQASLNESNWKTECLTGETPAKKRQGMVDDFQNGLTPVIVCTFGAGGVGLTLTAARTILLLDRPWTPGDAHQAEDRVRRIGQKHPVTSIWMTAFEIDKQIDQLLAAKHQTSHTVLSGGNAVDVPKLSIMKLLQSLLPAGCTG